MKKIITDNQLLQQFFNYCEEIEKHPFFVKHRAAGQITYSYKFDELGDELISSNFDNIHLESFLTRLRQFINANEMFYVDKLHTASNTFFGNSLVLDSFVEKLKIEQAKKITNSMVSIYGTAGKDLANGWTFKELMEARLYTGAIHSERRVTEVDSSSLIANYVDAHPACITHVESDLAAHSMTISQHILSLRRHLYNTAETHSKVSSFQELLRFDERVKLHRLKKSKKQ